MNTFEKIIYLLSYKTEKPAPYGSFHLIFSLILVLLTLLICFKYRNSSDTTMRLISFIFWFIVLVLEIYKQIVYSFNYDGEKVYWKYKFYAFPFQLCSTELYVLPFIFLLKNGKFRDSLMAYMSTFSLLGGLAVYISPQSVLTSYLGVSIQTMIHHGSQILLGVYFFVYNRKKATFRYFLSSIWVFLVFVVTAIILNEIGYLVISINHLENQRFNMFYMSPYYPDSIEILKPFTHALHPVIFIIGYSSALILGSFICYIIMKGICELIFKK